ncbi:potassium channel family protein [Paracoccus sp. (in: a-proteobacteria)]|uniref:potassium channel family protein n=1 Tax=Paracoccus sp. TaxID=267 RepID=UPI003A8478CE
MLSNIIDGFILVALTVAIHSLALGWSLKRLKVRAVEARAEISTPAMVWLLSRLAVLVIMAHLVEILVWAVYFDWRGVIPGVEQAFYFSAVTYATIGYGDIVPPQSWRLIASMEGLTGILMCGWSGGYFFAVVSRLTHLE